MRSAEWSANPDSTFTRSRNGSRDFSVGEKTKSFPVPTGVHAAMLAPFGTYIKLSRGIALVGAAKAGDIASRNGRANAAPRPRRNERRSSAILVTNIGVLSFGIEKLLI